MSCIYDFHEKLKANAPKDEVLENDEITFVIGGEYLPRDSLGSYLVRCMQLRLAEFGKHMLLDDKIMYRVRIRLVGDGEIYEFSGNAVTEQYQTIIRKLSELESIDLTADYIIECRYSEISDQLLDSDAEHEIKEIIRQEKERGGDLAEALRGVTYQIWCSPDDVLDDTEENWLGYISTYGELDGMVYDGEKRQLDWKDLPDGEMEIPLMFGFCMEHPDKEDYDRYKRLAERHPNLMDVPGEYDPDNCSVYNDMSDLYLPGGKADFDATMEIAQELLHLPNDAFTEADKEFVDGLFQNTYFKVKGVDEDGFVYFADAVLHAEAPVQILSVKR